MRWPKRAKPSPNRDTRRRPTRRPIFSGIISAATTAACCTTGGTGVAKCDAYLDDYAGLGNALLTLHENGGPPARLDQAVAVAEQIMTQFSDPQHGGFFYTAADHEPLIVRKTDFLDSPTPSGNGLAATLLMRLAAISVDAKYRTAAEATLRACFARMRQMPTGTFQLLLAMDLRQ